MLVYLDSADLARLESASDEERDAFFSLWRKKGCELALSLHHLQEISQLADRVSANRRLDTLADTAPLRCKPATEDLLLRFEIQVQAYHALGINVDLASSALDTFFPRVDPDQIREAVEREQPAFGLMRSAYLIGAEATNLGKEAKGVDQRSSLRRRLDPDDLNTDEIDQLLSDSLTSSPPALQALTRRIFDQVRTAIASHGSPRNALEALFDLSDVAAVADLLDDDLPLAAVYYETAREEVPRVLERLNLEASIVDSLVRELNPYHAPGFSLRVAVHRARKHHPKRDGPGEDIDAAHVSFAPYVDLLFVDKHTFGLITQESRDRPELLDLSCVKTVKRGGSMTRLIDVLGSQGESA